MDDGYEADYDACLDPLANDAKNDPDGDGLINNQEFVFNTNPCSRDTDGDGLSDPGEIALGSNPRLRDTDGDGCTDGQEAAPDQRLGGQRDPTNFWDYADMPDPNATPQRDRMIRVPDIMRVLLRYGTDDEGGAADPNRNTDPLSMPPKTGYHPAYDRGGQVGPNSWDQAPADGMIRIADVLAVVYQYGHDCA